MVIEDMPEAKREAKLESVSSRLPVAERLPKVAKMTKVAKTTDGPAPAP